MLYKYELYNNDNKPNKQILYKYTIQYTYTLHRLPNIKLVINMHYHILIMNELEKL